MSVRPSRTSSEVIKRYARPMVLKSRQFKDIKYDMGGIFDNFWLYFIFGYIFDPFLCFLLFHRAGSLSLRVQSVVNALQWSDNEREELHKKKVAGRKKI